MVENKRALITGLLGQDGSFMAELLYSKGYRVYGVIGNITNPSRISWIKSLVPNIEIIYDIDILRKSDVQSLINVVRPDEIYNFAGVSNVFNEWEKLDLIFNLNARVPQYILESILKIDKSIKFFQASSCLIFGRDESGKQNELTPYNPIHPYGISKLYADNMVREFRKTFGLFACSGIFYNHESERRADNFFTKKIINAVVKVQMGSKQITKVGNLNSLRDFGYAKDYMEAVWRMLNASKPNDYVIGSGQLISMQDFCKKCFEYAGLDYTKYIETDNDLIRKNDTNILCADITKIKNELGWKPSHNIDDIIKIMIEQTKIKK